MYEHIRKMHKISDSQEAIKEKQTTSQSEIKNKEMELKKKNDSNHEKLPNTSKSQKDEIECGNCKELFSTKGMAGHSKVCKFFADFFKKANNVYNCNLCTYIQSDRCDMYKHIRRKHENEFQNNKKDKTQSEKNCNKRNFFFETHFLISIFPLFLFLDLIWYFCYFFCPCLGRQFGPRFDQ